MRWAALALAAIALTGCETTAEKSAKLEHQAKLAAAREHKSSQTLSFTHESAIVKVLASALLQGSETSAALVTVRNTSAHALEGVPIEITVKESSGAQLFKNDEAGSEAALVSIPSLPAHAELTWVDDQVPQRRRVAQRARRRSPVGERPPPADRGLSCP